jgi:hypothetical protein
MSLPPLQVQAARADERDQVVQVTREAEVFNAEEIAAVEELFDDYVAKGLGSTYQFRYIMTDAWWALRAMAPVR